MSDLTPDQSRWLRSYALRHIGETNALIVKLRRQGRREDDYLLREVKLLAASARRLWELSIDDLQKGEYRRAQKRATTWPKL